MKSRMREEEIRVGKLILKALKGLKITKSQLALFKKSAAYDAAVREKNFSLSKIE